VRVATGSPWQLRNFFFFAPRKPLISPRLVESETSGYRMADSFDHMGFRRVARARTADPLSVLTLRELGREMSCK
jgi:hypothetical protein